VQVEMLQSRLPGNRTILSPAERQRLMKAGAETGHAIEHTLGIVTIKTYRRWLRETQRGRQPRKVGRPHMTNCLRELIVRLARENVGWGVRRIVGELKKLALKTSRSSVRRVLVAENILPDPERHAPKGVQTPWRKFLAIHMNVMVACDFFCKTLWTPLGRKTAYVLSFIHLASRKVFLSPSTCNPTGEWMRQQARNVTMWAQDEGIDVRFLIHDRDSKFTEAFDEHFRRGDGGAVLTPYGAPIANSFVESWIGSLKRECLNHFFCFSLRQLDHVVQTYALYYNQFRPHQSLGNRPLGVRDDPPPRSADDGPGVIRRQSWLGGLLGHYCRQAA
ncbi:MAG: integrase core domain-containing protein, partial [Phycisphaerae bacterium]|nr:integrase core domain-containing protein [Phycisphaerae bacterium]